MPAPDPSLIVANPPPLNPLRFPWVIDEFPADTLLGPFLARLAPVEEPAAVPADPARIEQR